MHPKPHPARPEKDPSSANRTGQESIDYSTRLANYGKMHNEKRVPQAEARRRFAKIRRIVIGAEVLR